MRRLGIYTSLLLAGCGIFHRSDTVKAAKEAIKATPDLVDALKALVAALSLVLVEKLSAALAAVQGLAQRMDDLAPAVKHAVETIDVVAHRLDDVLRWVLYLVVPGAVGGLFSFGKTGYRFLKKRLMKP